MMCWTTKARTAASSLASGLILLGVLLACKTGKSTLDDKRLETSITEHLTKQGVKVDKVDCPDDEPKKSGHKFECVAQCQGTSLHMSVTVTDDKGSVSFVPRDHTFTTDAVAKEIEKLLEKKGHKIKKVDCHGKIWVATKDATHTCDVEDEEGTKYRYTAVFTGEGGKHKASLAKL